MLLAARRMGQSLRSPYDVQGQPRRFGGDPPVRGLVARGSFGHPMLEGINYGDEFRDSPSQMETCFAIFADVLELDDSGEPVHKEHAE